MGGSSSRQTIETTLNTDVLNETIQNFITTNSQTVSASGMNIQKLDVKFGNLKGCDFITNQTIDSEVVSSGELSSTDLTELQTQAESHLENNVDALMEKMSGFGSLQFENDSQQDVRQNISNTLKNVTETTFETDNYNEIVSSVINIQNQKIEAGNYDCTKGGQINLNQDISSKVIATALTEQLVDRFVKDEKVAEIINKVETEQSNRDEGVGEATAAAAEGIGAGVGTAVRSIGESFNAAFGGGAAGPIIFGIIILFIIVGGAFAYYKYKQSKGRGYKNN